MAPSADGIAISNSAMQVMARACGYNDLSKLHKNDLATWHQEMALLSGVAYSWFTDISGNV